MDTLNRIVSLMKANKMSQKEVCERLGIKQQAFTNWKNGNNDSYMKKLPQIAEILGVSVDYLLGRDPTKPSSGPDDTGASLDEQLTGIDFALHGEVRDLTEDEKRDILDYIRFKKAQRDGQIK